MNIITGLAGAIAGLTGQAMGYLLFRLTFYCLYLEADIKYQEQNPFTKKTKLNISEFVANTGTE